MATIEEDLATIEAALKALSDFRYGVSDEESDLRCRKLCGDDIGALIRLRETIAHLERGAELLRAARNHVVDERPGAGDWGAFEDSWKSWHATDTARRAAAHEGDK